MFSTVVLNVDVGIWKSNGFYMSFPRGGLGVLAFCRQIKGSGVHFSTGPTTITNKYILCYAS